MQSARDQEMEEELEQARKEAIEEGQKKFIKLFFKSGLGKYSNFMENCHILSDI